MAFSKWLGDYDFEPFTPSPFTASKSLPSGGSSTPRSLGDRIPSLPAISPLSTLGARFETLDMNHVIERFLTFQQPTPPVDPCTHNHQHHHTHSCHEHYHSEYTGLRHNHIRSTSPAPIPRVSLERLRQFHQRHSCPPELSYTDSFSIPSLSNHINSKANHTWSTNPFGSARQSHSNLLAPTSAHTRKPTIKTSSAYQRRAADKCTAAAKARSKASSSRTFNVIPTASGATAANGTPTTPQAPVTVSSEQKQRSAKRRTPKNVEALAKMFSKCVRHYTDFVPGPKVYFTPEELVDTYEEVLDAWTPPPDRTWEQYARRYVTEDGRELYQCLLMKGNESEDCACRYGQTKAAVRRHINDVHLGIRNWKCPFDGCNKSFKQRCTLKIHICVMHTRKRPYQCLHCDELFSDPAQRNKHYKCSHPDLEHPKRIKQAHDLPMDEADVYGCFFCPERCTDSRSRAVHCQEAHPDKFIPGVMVPSVSAMLDDEDMECDHEDDCDCEFD